MKKLLALYRTPKDPEVFLSHYNGVHAPLAKRVPGLLRIEVTQISRTLVGEQGNFLLAELYFDDETFREAMKSAENADLGMDLANFADGLVTVMTGDVTQG